MKAMIVIQDGHSQSKGDKPKGTEWRLWPYIVNEVAQDMQSGGHKHPPPITARAEPRKAREKLTLLSTVPVAA
ncbi:hypothetical protein EYF80_013108 [Liparis tanakae]|uniref:Uncharacterized protein n=1 Tax=Liparis tanakae TaxID=230148 RepID=A0A4Z2IFC1_9TELE|nr:hypothetical protein EYF80_013108 [Liparis tanakae]